MTSSLRKNRRITLRAKKARNRTACSVVALLLAGGAAFAEPGGKPASTFVSRNDMPKAGLAAPVMLVQGKEPEKNKDIAPPKRDDLGMNIGAKPGQDPYEAYIRLDPPGKERLFSNRDTERELEERMRQERRDVGSNTDPISFPPPPQLSTEPYKTREFSQTVCLVEPSYVVYRRLYFEEKNAERFGWNIGLMQPALSTLVFLKDVLLLPHNLATYPCRRFETNAGQCLPGDPVPYVYYPPELTGSGLLAEIGVVALLAVSIP